MTALQSLSVSNTELIGPLPRTMLQLPTCAMADGCGRVGLAQLIFDQSDICAPADDEFTAWLDGIYFVLGARCAAVPALPGLAHVLMSLLLAGLGAVGIRRRGV